MSSESDYLSSIPMFDGNAESYSVMEYFQKFEAVARHFNWASDKKLHFVKLRLDGLAKNHVGKIVNVKDYDTLKNCLIEQFYKRNTSITTKADKFSQFVQPANMPVKDFITRVEALSFAMVHRQMQASKQGLSPENFVSFRSKLEKDILLSKMRPQILKRVMRRQPQTLKQIKHFAIQEERMLSTIGANIITSQLKKKSGEIVETGGTIESLNCKIKELDTQVTILSDKINHLQTLLNGTPEAVETLLSKDSK